MNWEIILRLVILLLASLATGGLMANWVGLARAMARISSASAYTEVRPLSLDGKRPIRKNHTLSTKRHHTDFQRDGFLSKIAQNPWL